MADRYLTIDARLDKKAFEKQYRDVRNEMEKLSREISEMESPDVTQKLADDLERAKQQLADTTDYIRQLQAQQQELSAQKAEDPFGFARGDGEARLAALQGKLAEAQKAANGYSDQIDKAQAALDAHNEKLGRLKLRYEILGQSAEEYAAKLQAEKVTAAPEEIARSADRTDNAISRIANRIKGLAKRIFFFSVIARAFRSLLTYTGQALKANQQYSQSLSNLKLAAGAAAQPLVNVLAAGLTRLLNLLTAVATAVARVTALLGGTTVKASADAAKAISGTGSAAKEAGKSLAGFDELNVLSDTAASGGSAGTPSGSMDTTGLDRSTEAVQLLTRAWEALGRIVNVVSQGIAYFKETVLTPLADALGGLAMLIGEKIVKWLENVADWLEQNQEPVSQWITLIGCIALAILAVVTAVTLVHGAIALLTALLSSPLAMLALLIAALAAIVVWAGNGGEAIELFQGIFSDFVQLITDLINGDWDAAWEDAYNIAVGALNLIIVAVESFLKFLASGINSLINGINSLGITIPEYIPLVGGKRFSPNIPTIPTDWSLPRLARGAVIPPNREFLAVLGDQRSGTNIEAPEATLRKIMAEVLAEYGSAMDRRDVTVNLTAALDGEVIYRNQQKIRAGKGYPAGLNPAFG